MSTFQEVVWDSTIPTVGSASLPHHHVFAEATSTSTESVLVMHLFWPLDRVDRGSEH